MDDKRKTSSGKPYRRYRSSRVRSRFRRDIKLHGDAGGGAPRGQPSGGPEPVRPPGAPPQPPAAPPRPAGDTESTAGSWWKRIGAALLVILLVLLVFAGVSYWRVDRAVRASNARVPADVEAALARSPGAMTSNAVNILFIGSDQRPGEPARADTLLLMRVDAANRSISQLSIPRDTLADIPGYGEGKINSAYAYGGPALQIEAVQELTGLPVHHYVELDFDGFPEIVDSLGGVDIDVPKVIDSQYPEGVQWTDVHFDAGPQHMDGETALVYVRVRYSDDDFQRMGRQQQFMEALQKRMTSPFNMMKMPLVAPEIIGNMTTDLSTNELIRLAWVKYRTPAGNSRKLTLAGYGSYIGGVSYVVLDEQENQAIISEFLGE